MAESDQCWNAPPSGPDVRSLMRSSDRASLATIAADGSPYASLVLLALDLDASPLMLLSDLAEHSRNIARDSRISLLIDRTAGLDDPLTGSRASLTGTVTAIEDKRLMARFVNRHPSAAAYAGFGDFRLYRMNLARAHLVAGFGRIRWIEGSDILADRRFSPACEGGRIDHRPYERRSRRGGQSHRAAPRQRRPKRRLADERHRSGRRGFSPRRRNRARYLQDPDMGRRSRPLRTRASCASRKGDPGGGSLGRGGPGRDFRTPAVSMSAYGRTQSRRYSPSFYMKNGAWPEVAIIGLYWGENRPLLGEIS